MPIPARYRGVLAIPGAARLLVSTAVARLPVGMWSLAIVLLVRSRSDGFRTAGVAVAAFALAGGALAPLQGRLIDRHGPRVVVLPCAVGQGALLGALALAAAERAPAAVLVVLAGAAGAAMPPISACVRTLWRQVAPDVAVAEAAYALDAIVQELIWTVGPLLVAALVALGSPVAAVAACGAISLVGGLFFVSGSLARAWQESSRPAAAPPRGRGGALSSAGLRALLGSIALTGLAIGAILVGLPALAVHEHARAIAGVLVALWSVGSVAGGLLYGAREWRAPVAVRYRVLVLAVAIGTAPLIVAHSLVAAIALSALAGIAYAPMLACQYSLVGSVAPINTTAEAFTWTTAALVAGSAAGSALAGALVDAAAVGTSFALAVGAGLLAAAVALSVRERVELAARPV